MNIGFVVPCFNEASRWDANYWDSLFSISDVSWLLIDDGSTDNTYEILNKHSCETVNVYQLQCNAGKGEAVRQGLLKMLTQDFSWIGFIDADGAFTVDEVQRFVDIARKESKEIRAVWSSRVRMRGRTIERSVSRHAVGRTIATALSFRYPNLPYDSQAGLKLFRVQPEFEASIDEPFQTRWLFDVELYTRLERLFGEGSNWLWEEPLDSWHHVPGSKISPREAVRIPIEIVRLLSIGGRRRADRT